MVRIESVNPFIIKKGGRLLPPSQFRSFTLAVKLP
jgi:hypothetical protein